MLRANLHRIRLFEAVYVAPENGQRETTSNSTPNTQTPREALSAAGADLPPAYTI